MLRQHHSIRPQFKVPFLLSIANSEQEIAKWRVLRSTYVKAKTEPFDQAPLPNRAAHEGTCNDIVAVAEFHDRKCLPEVSTTNNNFAPER